MLSAGGQGMASKNDASGFKKAGGAADILNAANMDVTQDALIKNVNDELQDTAKAEAANQMAEWEAAQKKAQIEQDDDFDEDEFLNDKELDDLQAKRLADMQKKFSLEKQFQQQGHGEYREIAEDEFLKEVCGSQWVVIHFHHREFFRCKVVDKHLRILAQKHLSCKWLTLDAEKAPFFVSKLAIRTLPTVIVFKDGIVHDQFSGFDELGGKDEFRTEVMEHWFSKAGCVIMKKKDVERMNEDDSDCSCGSDGDDD
jgi:hypothetical protein